MRIAINGWFWDQPGTGSGQYLQGLLRAMPKVAASDATQHRFLLVTPPDCPGPQVPGFQLQAWSPRATFWQGKLGKVLFEQLVFPQACRRWKADVAHVPYWGAPLWRPVPIVVTVHDLIPLLLPAYRDGPLVRLYTWLVSASARRSALVLTDSLASKGDIEDHLGLAPDRVRCIYLGIGDHFSARPDPDDDSIRQSYGLPGGSTRAVEDRHAASRYILYLAGHDVRKNVSALVEAFSTVAQADDDVTLAIGGRLPETDSALFYDPRPLVETLGIGADVRFLGWVDEAHKPALLRGAACAAFVSQYEGFGLPVLEALACGAPLVASNAASLPELVGDAGFVVDPDDVDALAGAMLACLVDEPLAEELRRRGPEQAAGFSWLRTAQETLAVYEEIAACAS